MNYFVCLLTFVQDQNHTGAASPAENSAPNSNGMNVGKQLGTAGYVVALPVRDLAHLCQQGPQLRGRASIGLRHRSWACRRHPDVSRAFRNGKHEHLDAHLDVTEPNVINCNVLLIK